ncbi:MAG: TIGR00269 family protein [Nitrososphaerota archaeon]|nr:TIGR00269 family protein [Candidatus Bathyarchaeota archaeon]MDW8062297.1 TIGR00269 family protein [Nitrososphaerota archaeon]
MKCIRCDREAVYFRVYSGEAYCARHFASSIEDKVRATIRRYRMLDIDDRIAVGVSGGKDSLTLLRILVKIERSFPKAKLYAVTIDEGIEGYRRESIELASREASKLGVEHIVVSFRELYGLTLDLMVEEARRRNLKLTPCSICGVLRRKALNYTAVRIGANKLATAHNLDDEAQTFVVNILHGDLFRLIRTKPVTDRREGFVQRIKPLREIPEKEIALYAYLESIEFQSEPCPYRGLSLRNDVRVFLNTLEEKHPGIKFTVVRIWDNIRSTIEKDLPQVELRTCRVCGDPSISDVCSGCSILAALGLKDIEV